MQGFTFYEGPSAIDGGPIVAIATGLLLPSTNRKTGPLVQVYMLRSDTSPMRAVQTGEDASVCGACKLRGRIVTGADGLRRNVGRSCYVTLIHGPKMVYDAFRDGKYPRVPLGVAARLLRGRQVRVGAYGDPASVPLAVWEQVLDRVGGLTSYTHLWRDNPDLSFFCMASVDSRAEREEAKQLGFRTFRVRHAGSPVLHGEGRCPAAKEIERHVQCVDCMLCGGSATGAKADITIQVHGTGAKHFPSSSEQGA